MIHNQLIYDYTSIFFKVCILFFMEKKILITGGIKSGKSIFAEKLVLSFGKKSTYIATAEILDEEFRQRIALHKQRRKGKWYEFESSIDLSLIHI